mmetsp:Transcript_10966/g.20068  ORF Transcript_10966/g.20068 Transcript_10966/m.20068 type:complete len:735 (+) Transcript_10966:126-2330(+)
MSGFTTTTFDVGITTMTDVDAISRIAYDIRDMADHIEKNEFLDARRIYEEGKHSPQYDRYGNEKDEYLSLQRMANSWKGGMFNEDPNYIFQMLGMADIGQSWDEAVTSHGSYADSYITELLNDYSSGTLGAQASTILIVSMYATHELWDGMLDCFAVKNGFNPEADKTGKINPKQSFDRFIALYVGAGQTLAPDWEGDMLYELAQAGGDLFDRNDSEGEATVNSDIRQLMQSIQRTLSVEDYCKTDESIEMLWLLSNRIIARMYIPMVQMLIHSMKQDDQAHKVKMYALAVIPQLSQCSPSVHGKLKDYLLDKVYDKLDFDRIVSLLQQSYDCLGFTCEDLGTYMEGTDDVVAECAGYEKYHPMAGFVPKRDVRSLSKADLDILAVDQLLKVPSTTKNQMAQLYFKYGKAAEIDDDDFGFRLLSLEDMTANGASEEGQWSPYYSDYVEYFKRDNFDDSAIMIAFEDTDMDAEQRSAYIVHLMRYNVVPEYMMSLIGLTLQLCPEEDSDISSSLYWDAFAALYIGSLEGIKASSSDDSGMLLWNLANNRARQFNTQNDKYMAKVNDEMTDLFFAGQSELERKDCTNFEKTASRALHLMLVPLIQSTIWHAIRNEKLGVDSTDKSLAIGEVMAFSVLPIVSKYDKKAAAVIERNMVLVDGIKPVSEGPQAVANAFFKILGDIGWGCEYIGQAEGIDACEQFDGNIIGVKNTGSMLFTPGATTIFVGLVSVMLILTL